MDKAKQVTAYIAKLPVWQAAICKELRDAVHEADANIVETMKWGSPTFEHEGIVAWMFAAKEWIHFSFPQGALLEVPDNFWEEGEDTESKGKRTLKFREGSKVPSEMIMKLVKQAVANNVTGKKIKFTRKPSKDNR